MNLQIIEHQIKETEEKAIILNKKIEIMEQEAITYKNQIKIQNNYIKQIFQNINQDIEGISKIFKRQYSSASMLENLINDLMDMAKIENNKFSQNQEYFDLSHTIKDSCEALLFQAIEKQIEIEVKLENKSNLNMLGSIYGDERRIK